MSAKSLIYVAGNPDAYPLEYYDEATGTYQGVIPQLLARFSEESGYDVVYYSPQAKDQREHLAKNLQVDLLSGYTQGDDLPGSCTTVRLFHTVSGDGGDISYYLCATEAAPAALLDELSAYFAALPQETVSSILMETSAPSQSLTGLYGAIGGLALGVVLLLTILLLTIRRYRKLLRQAQQDLERDGTTGLGNLDYLQRYYSQFVSDKNRVLYQLIFFCGYRPAVPAGRRTGVRRGPALLRRDPPGLHRRHRYSGQSVGAWLCAAEAISHPGADRGMYLRRPAEDPGLPPDLRKAL